MTARATRPVASRFAEFGVDDRRHVADGAVRPLGVVVDFPDCQDFASMNERYEQGLVQQLVTQYDLKLVKAFCVGLPGAT